MDERVEQGRVEVLQGFIIRRVHGGFCIQAVINGHVVFCGADRRWVEDSNVIGAPFRTFVGVEWYLLEWRVS